MLYMEIIAVCSQIHTKHINTALWSWTAGAQWLRCCSTNLKVVVSIPPGVIGIFH